LIGAVSQAPSSARRTPVHQTPLSFRTDFSGRVSPRPSMPAVRRRARDCDFFAKRDRMIVNFRNELEPLDGLEKFLLGA
jgi:hypothetical protein